MNFTSFLRTSELRDVDPASPEYLAIQRRLILSRKLVKENYLLWYKFMEDSVRKYGTCSEGYQIELGSGGGFLKDVIPKLITSDIVPVQGIDLVVDGRQIPFRDQTVSAIYMTHVLHHIPDVETFFREILRALKVGGIVAMIEVAATPFARLFFGNFHHEPFRPDVKEWRFAQNDAMLDSNQALSWIIFKRDIERFRSEFAGFQLCEKRFLPWFSYFFSGGVTKPYLIPDPLAPLFKLADYTLAPLDSFFALHWGIVLKKK